MDFKKLVTTYLYTPTKNRDNSMVSAHNLGQIGGKRDGATEAYQEYAAGSDGEADSHGVARKATSDDCPDGQCRSRMRRQAGLKCEQLRKLISLVLAGLMGFTSANAYVPPQGLEALGGESTLRVETAVLLDEKGVPRCRVGEWPSEVLATEAELAMGQLDALRECDERDELYARLHLDAENIQLGMAPLPSGKVVVFIGDVGKAAFLTLANVGMGFAGWCLNAELFKWAEQHKSVFFGFSAIASTIATVVSVSVANFELRKLVGFLPGGAIFPFMLGTPFGMYLATETVCPASME